VLAGALIRLWLPAPFARVTANVYEQTWPDVAVAARVFYPDGKEPTELTCPLLRSR